MAIATAASAPARPSVHFSRDGVFASVLPAEGQRLFPRPYVRDARQQRPGAANVTALEFAMNGRERIKICPPLLAGAAACSALMTSANGAVSPVFGADVAHRCPAAIGSPQRNIEALPLCATPSAEPWLQAADAEKHPTDMKNPDTTETTASGNRPPAKAEKAICPRQRRREPIRQQGGRRP